jgi:site-specific recombinase XerD
MTDLALSSADQNLFVSAFAGMDREAALAFVSRLYDASANGYSVWSDAELTARFLAQCSRTGSPETVIGYRRELQHLATWLAANRPGVPLRSLDPQTAENAVADLRCLVHEGRIKPSTFNRRVACWSALWRWASEPTRSGVTGIARNPFPRHLMLATPKVSRALTKSDLNAVLHVIAAAAADGCQTAARDYVLVRACYLIGCRVSELARLRWQDIEPLDNGGHVYLLGKGNKTRTIRISAATLQLIETLGRREHEAWLFPSRRTHGPISRQAIADRMNRWGRQAGVHLHPCKLRHSHATHALRAGTDVFVLQRSLGHSCISATANYVAEAPMDSSSLRLAL